MIKVESPEGDATRHAKPTLGGASHIVLGCNLNKRGVVLDLKDPEGRELALRLIETADVLVENFRSPEVMRRLGLGYEVLRERNPRLIYLQGSAYGPRGPMHGMMCNEPFAQAVGGLTSLTGEAGGRGQFSRGTATVDWCGAFTNLQAILVALFVRERTGRGHLHRDLAAAVDDRRRDEPHRRVLRDRRGAAPARQCPPQHRARPGVRQRRRLHRRLRAARRLLAEALRRPQARRPP